VSPTNPGCNIGNIHHASGSSLTISSVGIATPREKTQTRVPTLRILGRVSEVAAKRLVVIGASAGGIEALRVIAAGLPRDFPAAICVVVHTGADSPAMLDSILSRHGTLPAVSAKSMMRLEEGRIYVAPPDHHLLVEPGTLRVTKGPKENRFRPAIDPLFGSAAQAYGPAAVGVVLTGNLDDGTAGLGAIKRLGGIAIVQDPADAMYPSMPRNAAKYVDVDYSVALSDIAPLLVRVTAGPAERGGAPCLSLWRSK
jgi:two-component system chemotaxis response regulator CheB